MTASTLTMRRKADRESVARQFLDVAAKFGATVERRDEDASPGYSGAVISLSFTLNGVGAQVTISDLHERHGWPGGLISWFNTEFPARLFASGFCAAIGDNKGYPHHKATSSDRWDILAARMQAGLRHAAKGTAFQ